MKSIRCSKCGKAAVKAVPVRNEEGVLTQVKYQHEMIPGVYTWICTQVMQHEPKFNINGSVKKEMEKRPYAFKSRDASHYSGLDGRKVRSY